jgi:dTDP-4-dehydrorhamnose 3,5-epimerase-like enzyme
MVRTRIELRQLFTDPYLNIRWPLDRIGGQPQLNAKDASGLTWDQAPKF